MSWLFLIIAGLFEVVWATFLKMSEGFSNPSYSILTIIGMIVSFYFLSQATKTLPLGTAYAIWTGIGALGAVIVGIIFFEEQLSALRALFVLLLLVGIVGLKFTSQN
ncbi:MAG: multidrug efflux SMR transporter [Sporomusaceae bacterium]|nr:multidrug efflux SMR transporter [Sporomusaceae bacterium]